MILQNKSYRIFAKFYFSTHLCFCATVQSGHPKSPARTKVNLCKISLGKNKATIIILMPSVIQYAYLYLNLKIEDLMCGGFGCIVTPGLKLHGQISPPHFSPILLFVN